MNLEELAALSRTIGDPALDCVILGEGNTSCHADDGYFYVKASGTQLAHASPESFCRVAFDPLLAALDRETMTDDEVRSLLQDAATGSALPSTETFMHAYLLSLPDVAVVAHTHPTPLLSLLCDDSVAEISNQRLFPDEIVCCGPRACLTEYADPGLPLAQEIIRRVEAYVREEGTWPKTIWIRNHGLICLGRTASEVLTATRMSVKAARIWLGIRQTGAKATVLSAEQVARIHQRPDEHYRQRMLWKSGS